MNVCNVHRVSRKLPLRTNQLILVEFDAGCEAMVLNTDGTPLRCTTGGFGGDRRIGHITP